MTNAKKVLLDNIRIHKGLEINIKDRDYRFARELAAEGLISLTSPRVPDRMWVRAEMV